MEENTKSENFAQEFDKASILHQFSAIEEKPDINIPAIGTLGVINLIIIAWFIYLENYLGAFLFLLAGFTIFMIIYNRKRRKPTEIKCKIRSQGVQVGDTLYPYENLNSFWIFYSPPYHKEISLRSKKTFMDYIKVPLDDEDPVKIREILLEFLPERKQEEAFMDIFARNIGL